MEGRPHMTTFAPILISFSFKARQRPVLDRLRRRQRATRLCKGYVKRNKNDAADAEANCEAVTRPSMRFVPVKDVAQQSVLMLHRARNLLVRQRTMLVNALRAHLAEFGVIAPQGLRHVDQLIAAIDADDFALPELARSILRLIAAQLNDTRAKVRQIEAKLANGIGATGSANCWQPFQATASWEPVRSHGGRLVLL
jgi:transposase